MRNGWSQLLLWNKETLYPKKNCSLRLNAVTFKEFFLGTTFTCSNSTAETLEKRYEICPRLTVNTIVSRSDVFTVKCFYCWLWIGKCLSRSSFLCKYYYPKSKDEQMLYLASFRYQNFSKAKFSKYLILSSYSTYVHEKGFPANLLKLKML